MILPYAKAIVSTLLLSGIGIGLVRIIRKRLTSRSPVGAIAGSIAVVAATLLLITEFAGLDKSYLFPGLLVVAAFTGAICAQASPWSQPSILRALAVSAGGIVFVAVMTENYLAAALALLATGVLIKLYSDVSVRPARFSEDTRSDTSVA